MTWQSYKDDANAMRCMMASRGWRPSNPMSKMQKLKFFLFGRVFKRGQLGHSSSLRRSNVFKQKGSSDAGFLLAIAFIGWIAASWITHVVVCLKTASWGFLIAGAIMFPVAVIHGTGAWFGAW